MIPRVGESFGTRTEDATGMLLEQAESLVVAVMPDMNTPEYLERYIRVALDQYRRWGLTGVHDAGATLQEIEILKKLLAAGELPLRIYSMAMGEAAVEHYLANGPEFGLGDDRLTVRSFKIYVDGALGARGAEMSEPYSDAPEDQRSAAVERCGVGRNYFSRPGEWNPGEWPCDRRSWR